MSEIFSEIEELKVIYKEIIDGYSFSEEKKLYIKHLNDLENAELSRVRYNTFLKFKKDGLPSEEERIKQLIQIEEWSLEKEDRLVSYSLQISDNEKNIHNISTNVIPQQREQMINSILKIIDNLKKDLKFLMIEKRLLLGLTSNEVAEKEAMYHFITESFYIDSSLKTKYFIGSLDDLETEEIEEYIKILENNLKKFNEENIKKISVLGFFLNVFSYAKDDVSKFLNKPLSQITGQQLSLISLGNRNLNVLSQCETDPPELVGEIKIQDLVKWFDQQISIIEGKRRTGK